MAFKSKHVDVYIVGDTYFYPCFIFDLYDGILWETHKHIRLQHVDMLNFFSLWLFVGPIFATHHVAVFCGARMEDMSYMRHGICIFKNVNVEVPQGAARKAETDERKVTGIPSLKLIAKAPEH